MADRPEGAVIATRRRAFIRGRAPLQRVWRWLRSVE